MRLAHFDCFSGISGDMTLGALIDSGVDQSAIAGGVASLGLPVRLDVERVHRAGIAATRVHVRAEEQQRHRHLGEVEAILKRGALSARQSELALRIFRRLAEAEAVVHGVSVDKIHFHELGALDSIADIAGSAIGLDLLGVDVFTSRPVPPGRGSVRCAHGIMPVPAPGTAELLRGVPLANSPVEGELTTPTGAAILTAVVTQWQDEPGLRVDRIGYGAGQRDFPEHPNVLRILVGERQESPNADCVWLIECNLDDVSGEVIGYCYELLFAAGALDVYSTPVLMKKNRPGVVLSVLAPLAAIESVEDVLFRETGTLGIRRHEVRRHKLSREPYIVATTFGRVRGKRGWGNGRTPVFSPEYDDCARIAREYGVPLRQVYETARQAYQEEAAGRA